MPIISFLYTTFTHKEKHTQMRQKKEEKKKAYYTQTETWREQADH